MAIRKPHLVLVALVSTCLVATASDQTLLGTYEFTDNSLAATDANAADGITLSDFSIGTYAKRELFSDGSAKKNDKKQDYLSLSRAEVGGNSTSTQLNKGRYLSFTVTNNSGVAITLQQLAMDITNVNVPIDKYLNTRILNTATPKKFRSDTIATIGKGDDSDTTIKIAPLDGSAPKAGAKFAEQELKLADGESMTFYLPMVAEKGKDDPTAQSEHIQFDNIAIYAASNEYAAIPEPETLALWMSLLAASAVLTRRRTHC